MNWKIHKTSIRKFIYKEGKEIEAQVIPLRTSGSYNYRVRFQDQDGYRHGGKVFGSLKKAVEFADQKVDPITVRWS